MYVYIYIHIHIHTHTHALMQACARSCIHPSIHSLHADNQYVLAFVMYSCTQVHAFRCATICEQIHFCMFATR